MIGIPHEIRSVYHLFAALCRLCAGGRKAIVEEQSVSVHGGVTLATGGAIASVCSGTIVTIAWSEFGLLRESMTTVIADLGAVLSRMPVSVLIPLGHSAQSFGLINCQQNQGNGE